MNNSMHGQDNEGDAEARVLARAVRLQKRLELSTLISESLASLCTSPNQSVELLHTEPPRLFVFQKKVRHWWITYFLGKDFYRRDDGKLSQATTAQAGRQRWTVQISVMDLTDEEVDHITAHIKNLLAAAEN